LDSPGIGNQFQARTGEEIVIFYRPSTLAVEPTYPNIHCLPGSLSRIRALGGGVYVGQRMHEPDHSPPTSVEVKNRRNYISTTPCALVASRVTNVPL
jgi:hypothetical protein